MLLPQLIMLVKSLLGNLTFEITRVLDKKDRHY
jgi:hypothetical protein